MSGDIPLFPLYVFMARTRTRSPFSFPSSFSLFVVVLISFRFVYDLLACVEVFR